MVQEDVGVEDFNHTKCKIFNFNDDENNIDVSTAKVPIHTVILSMDFFIMDGTAIFDLPTWVGPFNPYNVTKTHSIFVKL